MPLSLIIFMFFLIEWFSFMSKFFQYIIALLCNSTLYTIHSLSCLYIFAEHTAILKIPQIIQSLKWFATLILIIFWTAIKRVILESPW